MFRSQACQDEYVLSILNNKTNGYFLEIGSSNPIDDNNSYILEKTYNWNGLLVEYEKSWEQHYKMHRKSPYIMGDATTIDYQYYLNKYNFPIAIDYLQIDLDVNNRSTFEHDIYTGDFFNTREISREIFKNNGYVMVFGDVKINNCPFEDWYVHPSQVNMDYINKVKSDYSLECREIINILNQNK